MTQAVPEPAHPPEFHAPKNELPIDGKLPRAARRKSVEASKKSDFSVDPLDCAYCDFRHICRVDVNALTAAKENER